jgi:hypothetical protein
MNFSCLRSKLNIIYRLKKKKVVKLLEQFTSPNQILNVIVVDVEYKGF